MMKPLISEREYAVLQPAVKRMRGYISCMLFCIAYAVTAGAYSQTFDINIAAGESQGANVISGRPHLMAVVHSDGGGYAGTHTLTGWYDDVDGNGATAPQVCQPVAGACTSVGTCTTLPDVDGTSVPGLSFDATGAANFCLKMPDVGNFAIHLKDATVAGTSPPLRSRPAYFELDVPSITLTNRSDTAACSSSPFTYMGEPFRVEFRLNAMNAENAVTSHYSGSKLNAASTVAGWTTTGANSVGLWLTAIGQPVDTDTCSVHFSNESPSVTSFSCIGGSTPPSILRTVGPRVTVSSASVNWAGGAGTFAADVVLERADTADGPYQTVRIGIAPQDMDGVTVLPASLNMDADNDGAVERISLAAKTVNVRHGRLRLANAYGSELLTLPMEVQAQYWDRNRARFVSNVDDSCTNLSNVEFEAVYAQGAALNTPLPAVKGVGMLGGGTGKGSLRIGVPSFSGGPGKTALTVTTKTPPEPAYLPGTKARATFGMYRSGPVIYLRELHY